MNSRHKIKSRLGVIIILASIVAGGILIFGGSSQDKNPEPAKPVKQLNRSDITVRLKATGPQGTIIIQKTKCPSKSRRCSLLEGLTPEDLKIKPGAVCSQQYGGPSIAEVTGVLNGQTVNATLSVKDGCQIALWNRLAAALGIPKSEASGETEPVS